jgi:AmiR/NasT family two-component response regulator
MGGIEMLNGRQVAPPQPTTVRNDENPGSHSQHKAVQNLNVALIAELDGEGERLLRELQRLRCTVRHIWPVPVQLPENYDVVYCTLTEDLPRRIPWLPGEPTTTLILVDRGQDALNLKLINNCAAHGLIHYPSTLRSTIGSLAMAREHFLYEQRLRGRIEKLDENLKTTRTVEKAKSILMRSKNLGEDDAYNFLRSQAMERRVTISVIAKAVVESFDLLG